MIHELDLSVPCGFPDDLCDASELNRLAIKRAQLAAMLLDYDETTPVVPSLLTDVQNILEAALAVGEGCEVVLSNAGKNPRLMTIHDQALMVVNAINACADDLGGSRRSALEDAAYAVVRSLYPLAKSQEERLNRQLDEIIERTQGEDE